MKICIIGNSHVASLKHAWDSMDQHETHARLTFFAARGSHLRDLESRDGYLAPGTDDLRRSLEFTSGIDGGVIDPTAHDLFLVYGLGLDAIQLRPARFYSTAVIEHTVADAVGKSASVRTTRLLRSLTEKRIFVGHQPLRAYKGTNLKPAGAKGYENGIEAMQQFAFSPLNAHLVRQPGETIVNAKFTHPRFSRGSVQLDVGAGTSPQMHPVDDRSHMNDEFGRIWLGHFLGQVSD